MTFLGSATGKNLGTPLGVLSRRTIREITGHRSKVTNSQALFRSMCLHFAELNIISI
jgi:hypothetical protein